MFKGGSTLVLMDKYCQFSTPHSCRKHLALYQWEQLSQRIPHSPIWLKLIYPLTPYESEFLTVLDDAASQLPGSSLQVYYLVFLALFPDVTRSKLSTWPHGRSRWPGEHFILGRRCILMNQIKIVRMRGPESCSAILEPPRESELDCCHDPAHIPFRNTAILNAPHSGSSL